MSADRTSHPADVVLRVGHLVGRAVVDEDGTEHGHLIDLHVVQDGPATNEIAAALRVDALVVGRLGVGERLGLLRHRVHGPWLLKVVARALSHRTRAVPWDAVVTVPAGDDDGPIVVHAPPSGGFDEIG